MFPQQQYLSQNINEILAISEFIVAIKMEG